jgi:Bacteriophage T4 gp9/10-like protein.
MSIIILDATTKSLECLMSGAPATTNPSYMTSYADDGTVFTEGEKNGALNGTTAVVITAAPAASTRRIIKSIFIFNEDTASVTITIRLNNSGTYRKLFKRTLSSGDKFQWPTTINQTVVSEGLFNIDTVGDLEPVSEIGGDEFFSVDVNGDLMPRTLVTGGGDIATDAIWTAAGDLAVGTGVNTAEKLTKGAEGTVLTSGATTISWQPASGIKWSLITADPNPAVKNNGYMCNTTGGAFTVTLPAAPSAGDVIGFCDAAGTFNTLNLTIGRAALNIMGLGEDMVVSTKYAAFQLVYASAALGWRIA